MDVYYFKRHKFFNIKARFKASIETNKISDYNVIALADCITQICYKFVVSS